MIILDIFPERLHVIATAGIEQFQNCKSGTDIVAKHVKSDEDVVSDVSSRNAHRKEFMASSKDYRFLANRRL